MTPPRVVQIPFTMGPMMVSAYLLIGEAVVIVDTGLSGDDAAIMDAIAREGFSADDVSLILLTHGHGDHSGGAEALRAMTGAPIAVGAADAEKCRVGRDSEMHARSTQARAVLALVRRRQAARGPGPSGPEADILLESETSLEPYGVEAVAIPAPGHTRGSLTVLTPAGDAIVGDLIGGGGRSHTKPERGMFVNDEDQMDESIRWLIARKPRLTYASHDAQPFTLYEMQAAFPELS